MVDTRIFLSYSRANLQEADYIDESFNGIGIKLTRDLREVKLGDNIKSYMKRIRETDYSIFLVSDDFLKSPWCLYELIEFYKEIDYNNKIITIVCESEELRNNRKHGGMGYIEFWKEKKDELVRDIKKRIDKDINAISALPEPVKLLKYFSEIHLNIGEFVEDLLNNNLYIPYAKISENGIKQIVKKIEYSIPRDYLIPLFEIINEDKFEAREKAFELYTESNPVNQHFYLVKGNSYLKENYIDLAKHYYEKALQRNTDFIPAYEAMIILLIKYNKCNEKEIDKYLNALEHIDKENYFVKKAKGQLSLVKGNCQLAIECFEKCLEIRDDDSEIYNSMGQAIKFMNAKSVSNDKELIQQSIIYYKKAIELNPNYHQVMNNLALLYLTNKEVVNDALKKAKQQIMNCLKINPNYGIGLNTLALVYEEEMQYLEAIKVYIKAFSNTDKTKSDPLNNIGLIMDEQIGNDELSEIFYNLAYEYMDEKNIAPIFNLGDFNLRVKKDYSKAENLLKKVVGKLPNNMLANCAYGFALYKLGKEKCLEYFDKCLKIDSTYLPAIVLTINYYLKANDINKALNYVEVDVIDRKYCYAPMYNTLGILSLKSDESGKSKMLFKKANEAEEDFVCSDNNINKASNEDFDYGDDYICKTYKSYISNRINETILINPQHDILDFKNTLNRINKKYNLDI